ncbi:MAG: FAD-dependent oxidoreductase, partial [Myxococcota bacterium]
PLDTEYDVVLVGAGVHSASFLYSLKKKTPNVRVLVVEQSQTVCSTFFKLGDSLVLNSPTFSKVGLNSNIVPGHFIQLSDFDELTERPFPTAKHVYELATLVFLHSDADIAFGFPVEDVERVDDRYRVVSNDRNVEAKNIVVANGMGDPRKASFACDRHSERIVSGDDFIASSQSDASFADRIRDRRVSVVGAGDTANSVMECLLPLAYPHQRYGFPAESPFLPRSLQWIGQPAKDIQEYYFANKARYCHSGGVIEFFWDGDAPFELSKDVWSACKSKMERVPERLVSVKHTADGLELQTSTKSLQTDLVVDCTGRSNPLSARLLQAESEFIHGDVVFFGGQWDHMLDRFVVAPRVFENLRIACKLKGERVFLLGSACPLDELIDDDEARNGSLEYQAERSSLTNSKWSLEHTLPRTVAFAEKFEL